MFILFTITILVLFLWGIKFKSHGWNDSYCGKEQANAIKGAFVLFLTVGHISFSLYANGYYPNSITDKVDLELHSIISQLVVVMFLFYSGYGISERIKSDVKTSNGGGYINTIPSHRALNTLLNYDVAVVLYLFLSPFTGGEVEWSKLPLYFMGLKKCANPTWYIFVIILCYLVTWASASLFKPSRSKMVIFHSLLIIIVGYVLSLFMEEHWYNTILCYALGFSYSQYKNQLELFFKKGYIFKLIALVVVLAITYFFVCKIDVRYRLITYNIYAAVFALLVVVTSYKIVVGNKAINWCGQHLFPIYMYQGLFFHSLYNIGGENHSFVVLSPFLYTLVSIVLTLITARLYHLWEINLK